MKPLIFKRVFHVLITKENVLLEEKERLLNNNSNEDKTS
jgi:hypothetical protein